ncbi:hypothetical protein LO772_17215 [Yinghuangia sp. ASG 101]|uniref:hypothetical protein n=1 Tax=Yinghuangia sp. ASG 101 TaxID=2896848 RepID=UPI001E3CC56A|nr:hypothetical protein [Yinghuangia sp. ASG 101]UGQ15150.1 hypothetical protein LO772_17215 [Yinghuangia sp. ASG 101]
MRRVMTVAGAVALCLAGATPGAHAADRVLTIGDPRITESSGLAASARHPGVFWTHNDSGGTAQLYAVGPDGQVKATVTLAGVKAVDWEAMASGKDENGAPALFVGDIGDNDAKRDDVSIYRIPEPEILRDTTVTPTRYPIAYDGGPRDAEALLVHPVTGQVTIASKGLFGAGLYSPKGPLREGVVTTFGRIADAPSLVTDGAYAPDGSRFILRGYFTANMFAAPGDGIGRVETPRQKQGESVTFSPDGASVVFGSEGKNSELWRVTLTGENRPDSVRNPAPPAAPPAAGSPAPQPPPSSPAASTPDASPAPSTSAAPADGPFDAPHAGAKADGDAHATPAWVWFAIGCGALGVLGTVAGLRRRAATRH